MGRLMTPRSQGGSAFENDDDFDEDGMETMNEDDGPFSYQNVDSSADFVFAYLFDLHAYDLFILPYHDYHHIWFAKYVGCLYKLMLHFLLMGLQDVHSKTQNNLAASFDVNSVQDQHHSHRDAVTENNLTEALPHLEVHGNGKVDGASPQIVASDTILPHTILPLKSTVHGNHNLNFSVLENQWVSSSHFSIFLLLLYDVYFSSIFG